MTEQLGSLLRDALHRSVDNIHADPDRFLAAARSRNVRPILLAVVVAATLVAALTCFGLARTGDHGTAPAQSVDEFTDGYANWGATRGDLAADRPFAAKVLAEWADPTGHNCCTAFSPIVDPIGPVIILWAGTTPSGPAAVVTQLQEQTGSSPSRIIGTMFTDTKGDVHLNQQLNVDTLYGSFDPNAVLFSPSPDGRVVVVVPVETDDAVTVSAYYTVAADGRAVHHFFPVPVQDGAAITTLPVGHSPDDAIVDVRNGDHLLVHSPVFATSLQINKATKPPANALTDWCKNCAAAGLATKGETSDATHVWGVKYGLDANELPAASAWSITGFRPDGSEVIAEQLWLDGGTAHTVVLIFDPRTDVSTLVSDHATVPATRPVVAARLPAGAGWLLGGGPGTRLEQWRVSGTSEWHSVVSAAADLIPTSASRIEVRMSVAGVSQVKTLS